jgi:hypothetical protein
LPVHAGTTPDHGIPGNNSHNSPRIVRRLGVHDVGSVAGEKPALRRLQLEEAAMKLNLGCGHNHKAGWLNVDSDKKCNPNRVYDLEKTPWPWRSNSFDEIELVHVLEHLGPTPREYLAIIKQIYRVCAPNATVRIVVPHPRHDYFLDDPTHVRPITPDGLRLFSKAWNRECIEKKLANSALGLSLDVDFEIVSSLAVVSGRYHQTDPKQWRVDENNVIEQYDITLRAIK